MPKQLKTAMNADQHVELLRSRGMQVDEAQARQWLTNVSYYRLSAYWYPARVVDPQGARTDRIRGGITFDHVVRLYEADRKLRTLVHDGVERIEVALRARLNDRLCTEGPLSYADAARFRPSFDHAEWLRTARRRVSRARRHNEAIKHYERQYGEYPFWVLAEVLDFADVSRLLEGMTAKDQLAISEGFGIRVDLTALSAAQREKARKNPPLVRWMEQLTVVRNTCAHHGRLWNTSFTPAPTAALRTLPDLAGLPEGQSERLFGALTVMSYLLQVTSPGTRWSDKVRDLLEDGFLSNPLVAQESLGIPAAWGRRV